MAETCKDMTVAIERAHGKVTSLVANLVLLRNQIAASCIEPGTREQFVIAIESMTRHLTRSLTESESSLSRFYRAVDGADQQ